MAPQELQLLRLVRAFSKIKDPKKRQELIELVEAALGEEAPEVKPAG